MYVCIYVCIDMIKQASPPLTLSVILLLSCFSARIFQKACF